MSNYQESFLLTIFTSHNIISPFNGHAVWSCPISCMECLHQVLVVYEIGGGLPRGFRYRVTFPWYEIFDLIVELQELSMSSTSYYVLVSSSMAGEGLETWNRMLDFT